MDSVGILDLGVEIRNGHRDFGVFLTTDIAESHSVSLVYVDESGG
jgi:hypothetical protein